MTFRTRDLLALIAVVTSFVALVLSLGSSLQSHPPEAAASSITPDTPIRSAARLDSTLLETLLTRLDTLETRATRLDTTIQTVSAAREDTRNEATAPGLQVLDRLDALEKRLAQLESFWMEDTSEFGEWARDMVVSLTKIGLPLDPDDPDTWQRHREALRQVVLDQSQTPKHRLDALGIMGQLGESAPDPSLVRAMVQLARTSRDVSIREQVWMRVEDVNGDELVIGLIEALQTDPDQGVREIALMRLSEYIERADVQSALQLLANRERDELAEYAREILGEI